MVGNKFTFAVPIPNIPTTVHKIASGSALWSFSDTPIEIGFNNDKIIQINE